MSDISSAISISSSRFSSTTSANPPSVSVPPKRSSSISSLPVLSFSALSEGVKLSSASRSVRSSSSVRSILSGCSRISSDTKGCPPSVLSSSSKSPSKRSARLLSSSAPTSGPVTLTVASKASKDSSAFSSTSVLRLRAESSDGISLKSKSISSRLAGSSTESFSTESSCISSSFRKSSAAIAESRSENWLGSSVRLLWVDSHSSLIPAISGAFADGSSESTVCRSKSPALSSVFSPNSSSRSSVSVSISASNKPSAKKSSSSVDFLSAIAFSSTVSSSSVPIVDSIPSGSRACIASETPTSEARPASTKS